MMKKIPGLNDLRIFEVAGRLQNFRQAAQELHLTHSAISHRIKSLEDQLGLILFERQNGVQLTDAGRELHRSVTTSLSQLSESIANITQHHSTGKAIVRISVLPSFAAYWLLPRLKNFYQAHPEVRLQIMASVELAQIGERGVDIAIRFGDGHWPKLQVQHWMNEYYYVVASPELMRSKSLSRKEDVHEHVLLQHAQTLGAGASWLQLFKKLSIDAQTDFRQISFDDSNLVIQAAEHGHGIAFERHSLVAGRIDSAALVRPIDIGLRSQYQYYLVTDPSSNMNVATKKVLNWLEKESREFDEGHQAELSQVHWL
jgi:LysR family glycine cleavage system transcriptional activator